MFKNKRPEPLSPLRVGGRRREKYSSIISQKSRSPSATLNADLFTSTTKLKDIKNMKIFDESNDEGMPKHWNDNLKPFQNPSIYDSLHSPTLRPELHTLQEVEDSMKKNQKRVFSGTRKKSLDRSNHGGSSK